MGIKDAIEFLETYLRDYVVYILRLFSRGDTEPPATVDDPSSKLMTYGLISLLAGTQLQQYFIADVGIKPIDFAHTVTILLCFWVLMALISHAVLDLLGVRVGFSKSLSAVLSVFPPAYLVGAFSAFCVFFISQLFSWTDPDPRRYAAVTHTLVQCGLLAFYLPVTMSRIVKTTAWRAYLTAGVVIVAVLFSNTLLIFNYYVCTETGSQSVACTAATQHQPPAADKKGESR